jgi:quinol monooxygenase YgiN
VNELQCFARLKIHDGKFEEFKRLSAKCKEIAETKDTGTLQYEQYMSPDNTECIVFERYRDFQALMEHHQNLGSLYNEILETCSGAGEVCGTPTAELIEQLKGSPVQVYRPLFG